MSRRWLSSDQDSESDGQKAALNDSPPLKKRGASSSGIPTVVVSPDVSSQGTRQVYDTSSSSSSPQQTSASDVSESDSERDSDASDGDSVVGSTEMGYEDVSAVHGTTTDLLSSSEDGTIEFSPLIFDTPDRSLVNDHSQPE